MIKSPLGLKQLKQVLGILILLTTIIVFVVYARNNPQLIDSLKSANISLLVFALLCYVGILASNVFILRWSVQICSKYINFLEATLLSIYSTLVNFFGPLQSGPGFRAVYLKKIYSVGIKAYTKASLLYYFALGSTSVALLLYGINPFFTPLLIVATLISVVATGARLKNRLNIFSGNSSLIFKIVSMTILQIIILSLIYYAELKSVNPSITFSQALVYTGVANLSLFVALTPGAIGIRESFLVLSEKLHRIDTDTILAASVADRAIFFLLLGLLLVTTTVFKVGKRLNSLRY